MLIPSNLKHVTLSTGLLQIVRRGCGLLLAVTRIISFVLLLLMTIQLFVDQVWRLSKYCCIRLWADSFPFSRISVTVASWMNLCTTHWQFTSLKHQCGLPRDNSANAISISLTMKNAKRIKNPQSCNTECDIRHFAKRWQLNWVLLHTRTHITCTDPTHLW